MEAPLRTHTLLCISGANALHCEGAVPQWVEVQLRRAPWVVVRRERPRNNLIPVGVRGEERAQRFAAWLAESEVLKYVGPLLLAARRGWARSPRSSLVPALAALDAVEQIMRSVGLARCWGPAGSVGFELASAVATAGPESDLDLIVQAEEPLPPARAAALHAQLAQLAHLARLPTRADTLLETPAGAVALEEYARGHAPLLLRTSDGARLVQDPWGRPAAA